MARTPYQQRIINEKARARQSVATKLDALREAVRVFLEAERAEARARAAYEQARWDDYQRGDLAALIAVETSLIAAEDAREEAERNLRGLLDLR